MSARALYIWSWFFVGVALLSAFTHSPDAWVAAWFVIAELHFVGSQILRKMEQDK